MPTARHLPGLSAASVPVTLPARPGCRPAGGYGRQHVLRVPVYLHVIPAPYHPPVRADQKGRPGDAHEGLPVEALLLPDTVFLGHRVVLVRQEGALPKFQKSNAAVLGISVLDIASKAKFSAKHELNFRP